MDKVNPKALKKDFDDRKDKDIDNDGDVDDSDEYLHNRRKTVAKAVKNEKVEIEIDDEEEDEEDEEEKKDVEESYELEENIMSTPGNDDYIVLIQGPGDNNQKIIQVFKGKSQLKKAQKARDDWNTKNADKIKKNKKGNPISAHMARLYMHPASSTMNGKPNIPKVGDKVSWSSFNKRIIKSELEPVQDVEESYELGTDEYRDHALDTTPGQSLTWGSANAYKQASMKEALAKVWGLDEKVLDKSEEDDKIAPVKGKKSMTGGKVADVDVDPEMKDEK